MGEPLTESGPVAIDAGYQAEIVETLEGFLNRARQGEFLCIAVAALTKGSLITTGWSSPPKGRHSALVGAVAYLEHRMHRKMDGEDD